MQKEMNAALGSLQSTFNASASESETRANWTMWLQYIVAGAATLTGFALAFGIGRSTVGPVKGITATMTRLAAGEHDVDVPARENTGELGAMERAVEVSKQIAVENQHIANAETKQDTDRDCRQAAMNSRTQKFGTSTKTIMKNVIQSAADKRAAAAEVSKAAARKRKYLECG